MAQGERAEALVTGLHSAPTLRAFSREQEQLTRIAATSDAARQITLNVFGLLTRFFARNNATELLGLVAILSTGFALVRAEGATVGAVTAAALFFHRLFNPIGALLVLFDELQSAGAALARLAGVANLGTALPSRSRSRIGRRSVAGADADAPAPSADTARGERPVLRLEGVGHCYVEGLAVLDSVDLTVQPGERVALVGSTGAGKTTLGAIAAGGLSPTSGLVLVGDRPLRELKARDHVVLVSQEVHVFHGTVRENVDLARPGATDPEIAAALDLAGATAWVGALPAGWATVVGDHGHPLSAAQAQQLALARVALRDAGFVVLDEATAEAGSRGARELEQAALAVTKGRAAIVVAHRLTQSAAADRVVVLEDGRVVEQGTHDDLVARSGRYAELWRAWSET